MASFINHKTNLSVIDSKLQSICTQIASPTTTTTRTEDDDDDATTRREEALEFLRAQKTRIVRVERSLLRLTHQVLPHDDDTSMSMTELSRKMRALQTHYGRRLGQLLTTAASSSSRRVDDDDAARQRKQEELTSSPPPQHWSVGRVLTSVPETDHETDTSVVTTGKSTASSSTFFKSPAYGGGGGATKSPWTASGGSASQKRLPRVIDEIDDGDDEQQHGGTTPQQQPPPERLSVATEPLHDELQSASETLLLSPQTPTNPRLSLSTQSILERKQQQRQSDVEEDDEEEVDEVKNRSRSSGQRRVDAFAALEQRRHRILLAQDGDEYRESDVSQQQEDDGIFFSRDDDDDEEEEETIETIAPTVVAARPGTATPMRSSQASNLLDQTWDDSARYCPTVVQTKTTPRSVTRRRPGPRPSHIEFDPRSQPESPAMSSVNMTTLEDDFDLDETMNDLTTHLDEAMAGLEPVQEDEEDASSQISTETPVLDRYRLDIDDKIPGGLVVRPNPRHRKRRAVRLPPFPKRKSPTKQPPSFVSTTALCIDENAPLNLTTDNQKHQDTFNQRSTTTNGTPSSTRKPLVTRQSLDEKARGETSFRRPEASSSPQSRLHPGPSGMERTRMEPLNGDQSPSTTRRDYSQSAGLPSSGGRDSSLRGNHTPVVVAAAAQTSTVESTSSRRSSLYQDTPSSKALRPTRLDRSLNGVSHDDEDNGSPTYQRGKRQSTHPSPYRSPAHRGPRRRILQIRPVSAEEYEASPRIVTMQVSLAQVHEAVLLLNQACQEDHRLQNPLTEGQIARIWGRHDVSDRQRTRLLLSLCHWRRLESRPAGDGSPRETVYHVVTPKNNTS